MHRTRFTRSAILAATLAGVIALPLSSSAQSSSRDIQAKAPADNTQAARQAIIGGRARNVILLLGDGMGDSEITIARNYQVGANGRLAMDTLPLTGEYTTYAVQKDDPTPAGVRDRLGRVRHRLGHRPQDLQRRHLGACPTRSRFRRSSSWPRRPATAPATSPPRS